jgi:sugar/nucleoside kinase (ribokinase family)
VTPAISVFGNLTIDDLVFPDGSTRWAVPGGSAAYAALGISLWTGSASIVAPIGADYPVEVFDKRIDLARCPRVARTLRNWGLYEDDGRRHFISRSAMRDWHEFSPKPVDAMSGSQKAAHIAPMPHDVAIELMRELRRLGTLSISLDLDDHDLVGKANLDTMIELIRGVDLFLPSHENVLEIFPDVSPIDAVRKLRDLAPEVPLIAVKCGADGVIAHVAGARESIHVPAMLVEVVDVTGAGDAFCGGVLAGFSQAYDPIEALLRGAVSASFCVESFGLSRLAAAMEEEAKNRLSMLRQRIEYRPM